MATLFLLRTKKPVLVLRVLLGIEAGQGLFMVMGPFSCIVARTSVKKLGCRITTVDITIRLY